jgi:hypothetical protein
MTAAAFRRQSHAWFARARSPFRQTRRGYTKPRAVWPGDRFGELTAVRILDSTSQGHRWLLRCECGGWAVRVTSRLNLALRSGRHLACRTCDEEYRRGRTAFLRELQREWFRSLWAETRSLYTERDEQAMADSVLTALEAEFGDVFDESIPSADPTWKETPLPHQRHYRWSLEHIVARKREETFARIALGRGWDIS